MTSPPSEPITCKKYFINTLTNRRVVNVKFHQSILCPFLGEKKKKVNFTAYAEIKQLPLHRWDLQLFHHTLSDFQ